ncbi:hypothetical protein ACH5RR_034014 [Cinchona calisaya]|uniref:Uncharacterized protein n=1 Tax=Cinchona calisaya TaxID=153742 RepID=A0ABD2YB00_9GENT
MDESSSSVAKRTRAKTRDIYKRLAEYNEKEPRDSTAMDVEDKKWRSYKGGRSGSDVVMLMEEEKGEEVDRNEFNKQSSETGQNARDVGEESRSDIRFRGKRTRRKKSTPRN